jgi:hypothetical protein
MLDQLHVHLDPATPDTDSDSSKPMRDKEGAGLLAGSLFGERLLDRFDEVGRSQRLLERERPAQL